MQHLQDQANRGQQQQEAPPPFPEDKCVKVRVVLDATDYYVPDGAVGFDPQPPFVFRMPLAYSEIRTGGGIPVSVGIQRHDGMMIAGAGIKMEVVDLPTWWDKRDSGII